MSLFTFRRANSDPSRTDAWNTNGHFVVNVAGTVGTNGHCALPKTFTCANGHSGVKNTNGQGPSVPVANGPWRQTGHNRSCVRVFIFHWWCRLRLAEIALAVSPPKLSSCRLRGSQRPSVRTMRLSKCLWVESATSTPPGRQTRAASPTASS